MLVWHSLFVNMYKITGWLCQATLTISGYAALGTYTYKCLTGLREALRRLSQNRRSFVKLIEP